MPKDTKKINKKSDTQKKNGNSVEKEHEELDVEGAEVEIEPDEGDENAAAAELDPEILAALGADKAKKKHATKDIDYIPELERGDIDPDALIDADTL